jgi:hypothetical protein
MLNKLNKKSQKRSSNKMLVGAVIAAIVILSTLVWHEVRTEKRDAAAAAQSVYED